MTHEIQEHIKATSLNERSDESLLTLTINCWGEVCQENDSQRDLVPDYEWTYWKRFKDENNVRLRDIVEKFYDLDAPVLETQDRDFIKLLVKRIGSAEYKSSEKLCQEINQRQKSTVMKTSEVQETKTHQEKKQGLLQKLFSTKKDS